MTATKTTTAETPDELSEVIKVLKSLNKAELVLSKNEKNWFTVKENYQKSQVIWLYLRENNSYKADYEALIYESKKLSKYKGDFSEVALDDQKSFLLSKWGLSELVDPNEIVFPKDIKFKKIEPLILNSKNLYSIETNRLRHLNKIYPRALKDDICLVIHPNTSEQEVLKGLRKLNALSVKSISGVNSKENLLKGPKLVLENILIHYAYKNGLKAQRITELLYEVFSVSRSEGYQTQQIKSRIQSFKKISEKSPDIFTS